MPHKDEDVARAYRREYQRKWREANPGKAGAFTKAWRERHPGRVVASRRAHYLAHAEDIKAKHKAAYDPQEAHEYYLANKEKIKSGQKAYRAANPEKTKARNKTWYDANTDHLRVLRKQYREANKETIEAKRKAKHWALKLEVWGHYGGPSCGCCGEGHREFLTIDHVNGGGRKHRVELRANGSQHIYQWLKKENFPEGYRVLCMNCNFAYGLHGGCPHSRKET